MVLYMLGDRVLQRLREIEDLVNERQIEVTEQFTADDGQYLSLRQRKTGATGRIPLISSTARLRRVGNLR